MDDLYNRLKGALPAEVPILRPEEAEQPLEGRKAGQPGGISGYLAAHPTGYVQLRYPSGLLSNGVHDMGLMQLEAVASTAAAAGALAQQVRRAIGSLPVRPTPWLAYIPPTTIADAVCARVITTYQTNTLGG